MEDKKTVAILMATYNGEKYIIEQIESILKQTYKNFVLYIRDDNSTDNTKEIISEYCKKYEGKIIEVHDDKIAKGVYKNFMFLLEYVNNLNKFDVYMFSDQDDIWNEDKVMKTVEQYKVLKDKERPILIHTDLNVVDSKVNMINKSFIKYSNLKKNYKKFNNYLVQNNVTGCTALINRSLVDLIKFDIKDMRMHDWYFALLASAFGEVVFIDEPTIKYRQHENNVIGAKKRKGISWIFYKLINHDKIKEDLKKLLEQAESFKSNYYNMLSDNNKKIIDDFIKIKNCNRFDKIKLIVKNKFYKQNIISIIGEMLFI